MPSEGNDERLAVDRDELRIGRGDDGCVPRHAVQQRDLAEAFPAAECANRVPVLPHLDAAVGDRVVAVAGLSLTDGFAARGDGEVRGTLRDSLERWNRHRA